MPIKIRLIVVGKIKERSIRECISEYEMRISPFAKLEIIELSDYGIEKESKKIGEYADDLPQISYILDAKGIECSSVEFATLIKRHAETGVVFIIGGSDGILENVKKNAKLISLSRMTFTHEMARLFLVEQIYRGLMINNNRKYHK
jgi:23S rRNA (pseudouridine1915-N3)-methyltransferase